MVPDSARSVQEHTKVEKNSRKTIFISSLGGSVKSNVKFRAHKIQDMQIAFVPTKQIWQSSCLFKAYLPERVFAGTYPFQQNLQLFFVGRAWKSCS